VFCYNKHAVYLEDADYYASLFINQLLQY